MSSLQKKKVNKEWEKFRRYTRHRVRKWDRQEKLKDDSEYKEMASELGIRDSDYEHETSSDEDDDISYGSSEEEDAAETPLPETPLPRKPAYDPDSDSE